MVSFMQWGPGHISKPQISHFPDILNHKSTQILPPPPPPPTLSAISQKSTCIWQFLLIHTVWVLGVWCILWVVIGPGYWLPMDDFTMKLYCIYMLKSTNKTELLDTEIYPNPWSNSHNEVTPILWQKHDNVQLCYFISTAANATFLHIFHKMHDGIKTVHCQWINTQNVRKTDHVHEQTKHRYDN